MPYYSGNSMGTGNPPGKYSDSYLTSQMGKEGHFVDDADYRGSMHVGINGKSTDIGNQPQDKSNKDLAGPTGTPLPA